MQGEKEKERGGGEKTRGKQDERGRVVGVRKGREREK